MPETATTSTIVFTIFLLLCFAIIVLFVAYLVIRFDLLAGMPVISSVAEDIMIAFGWVRSHV